MRPNTVKLLLQEGKPAIGTWLTLGSPLAAEWLAHQGFDWLNVEQEHGAIDVTLTQSLLQAISTTNVIPLIRIPWKDPAHCKRALDAGAYGLFVPSVNTREEAEMIVGAMKYPPAGFRGLGGTRRLLYGGADYVKHANDEILVIPMIETAEGVRNADDILSVPGIDACFIGPNDLAASMGLEPTLDPQSEEYEAAIRKVFDACKENGVAPGLHCPSAIRAGDRIEQGWQLIAINSDGGFMAQAASASVKAVRERSGIAPVAGEEAVTRPQY
jgi:4-hydroxy-2-oxoheptanedioate aldolase